MYHLAVLGRERSLCLAELESVCKGVEPFGLVALIPDLPDISRIGGSLKLAKIIARKTWDGWENLEIDEKLLPSPEGKLVFGVSCYGPSKDVKEAKKWALQLKKQLRSKGGVRAVVTDSPLSAAQLKFNQVLDKGFELIIAIHDGEAVVAITEAYQDIDWYSRRDYDRPARSAKVGMLPPKLAQMMINLTGANKVYDPFCGTGVVLQEALLMGKPASGSDLETKMVDYTLQNLQWLKNQVDHDLPEYEVKVCDARNAKLPGGFTVVSEGYLGPPLVKPPSQDEIKTLEAELTPLYSECLTAWHSQLISGQTLCLAVPCWQISGKFICLPLIDLVSGLKYNLVRFKHASSEQLIYARSDQIVGRQLLVLTKK